MIRVLVVILSLSAAWIVVHPLVDKSVVSLEEVARVLGEGNSWGDRR